MIRLDESSKEDVFVELIDFGKDTTAKEMVVENPDGSYTVFLNARYSFNQQQESARHALRHVKEADFEKQNVQKIEAEAHRSELVGRRPASRPQASLDTEKQVLKILNRLARKNRKRQKEYREREEFFRGLFESDPELYDDIINRQMS